MEEKWTLESAREDYKKSNRKSKKKDCWDCEFSERICGFSCMVKGYRSIIFSLLEASRCKYYTNRY